MGYESQIIANANAIQQILTDAVTIKDLKAGETYEHTIEKSELYNGKKVTYYAPFDKCDRVEDYKTAWAHFEEVFKEKKLQSN